MSTTRTLAGYLAKLNYEDLPPEVVAVGKLAIIDALGNAIGGYPLSLSRTFLDLAKDLGGGRGEATLIGDGTKVSLALAAFGNGALSTMLDYADVIFSESGRCPAWLAALAVPAALAAGETRGISGKELIASVVAGYEGSARIVDSMDMTEEAVQKVCGETVSVFAAAGAAGRALGLDEDGMLSTLGMAGIYTPVPGLYKWSRDQGLTPRKDIKHGWAWMCMTGAFAAVSAQKGLKMLQKNNILDGDMGLWRMLGMDIFKEERITAGLGETYQTMQFRTKIIPGCAATHTPIIGITGLVNDHNIDVGDIEEIQVITNKGGAIDFGDKKPVSVCDREFSTPYQVSAALLVGDQGPDWYTDRIAESPELNDLIKRVSLSFDEECDQIWREKRHRTSKVTVTTKSGQRFSTRVEHPRHGRSGEDIRNKFITTTSQVISRDQVDKILSTIDNLESVGSVSEMTDLLHFSESG